MLVAGLTGLWLMLASLQPSDGGRDAPAPAARPERSVRRPFFRGHRPAQKMAYGRYYQPARVGDRRFRRSVPQTGLRIGVGLPFYVPRGSFNRWPR